MPNRCLNKMVISDFTLFWFLNPKNQQFIFLSKINSYQIGLFEHIKNGLYSIELYSNNQCTTFEANIFIFGCAMAQQPSKGDDVTILKRYFDISNCRMSKQMIFFWITETKLDKIGMS